MLSLTDIRSKFLNYFKDKKHQVLLSSSLVPNDPSLLFTSAGMVPLKNYYIGFETPSNRRMCSCQKCVRANDLDNVGYTARHHTFFEMLGNFSIGDYFKKDAITWAWGFLTDALNLPPERLLATVYHDDEEAIQLWKDIAKLPDERIIRIATSDNFWEMGETGPCGPCTEIFYDHGSDIKGGKPGSADEDGDRYIEIWNNVFTQFERMPDKSLKPLQHKNIDTGIGLERLTAVLQGVHNNYDIDLFQRLIVNSKEVVGDGNISSHRIIADHLRASCFLIADGVLPSNEGRGYVLRRIMRRAMRHIHQLGASEPKMFRLVPCLVDIMGEHYMELKEHEDLIMDALEQEEAKFRQTLERGMNLLHDELQEIKGDVFSGRVAFTLYDTFGFPLDLTQSILKDKGIKVDTTEFDKAMGEQRARSAWVGSGDTKSSKIYFEVKNKISPTEFVGYERDVERGKILAIIKDGVEVQEAGVGDSIEFFVDKTPFYGESGGQIGDSGLAMQIGEDGKVQLPFSVIEIGDVKRPFDDYFLHIGRVESGRIKVGDYVNLTIDAVRRAKIRANHSGVHLLEHALRAKFGDKVMQKGSAVGDMDARFDFSLNRQVSREEIKELEVAVNDIIFKNTPTLTRIMPIEEAKKIGAIALFGEKYGDVVRVVFIGEKERGEFKADDVPSGLHFLNNSSIKSYYSVDFCGGTHVAKTGEIGLFKIVSESSIGSGVRRIEVLTGYEALKYLNKQQDIAERIASTLETDIDSLPAKVEVLRDELRRTRKDLMDSKRVSLASIDFKEEQIGEFLFASVVLDVDPKDLKSVFIDKQNKKYATKSVMVAIAKHDNKNTILLGVSRDLTNKFRAGALVKEVGLGGGTDWFASGSCNSTQVIDVIRTKIMS